MIHEWPEHAWIDLGRGWNIRRDTEWKKETYGVYQGIVWYAWIPKFIGRLLFRKHDRSTGKRRE